MYVCMYVGMFVGMYVCMCVCMYTAVSKKFVIVHRRYWNRNDLWVQS